MAKGILATGTGVSTSLTDAHITVQTLHGQLRIAHTGIANKDRGFSEPIGHFPAIFEVALQSLNLPELGILVNALLLLLLLSSLEEKIYGPT